MATLARDNQAPGTHSRGQRTCIIVLLLGLCKGFLSRPYKLPLVCASLPYGCLLTSGVSLCRGSAWLSSATSSFVQCGWKAMVADRDSDYSYTYQGNHV